MNITHIWLRTDGTGRLHVSVEVDGVTRRVITESGDIISHCVKVADRDPNDFPVDEVFSK